MLLKPKREHRSKTVMHVPAHERILAWFGRQISKFAIWYRLPMIIAIPTLIGNRATMREENPYDTERNPLQLNQ